MMSPDDNQNPYGFGTLCFVALFVTLYALVWLSAYLNHLKG